MGAQSRGMWGWGLDLALASFDGLDWTGDHANLGSSFQSSVAIVGRANDGRSGTKAMVYNTRSVRNFILFFYP